MRCPPDTEFWQRYIEYGDPEAARHLQSCAACRAEADHAARVTETLAQLPVLDAPASVTARFQALVEATTGRRFTCAEALSVLEAWREGDLDATQSLLMEDHLLWCDSCANAFAQAEQLSMTLRAIPILLPPASIAERLAAARLPWWQRMLQPIQPAWSRLAPAATGFCMAAVLLLACILRAPNAPQVASVRIDTSPTSYVLPIAHAPHTLQARPPAALPPDEAPRIASSDIGQTVRGNWPEISASHAGVAEAHPSEIGRPQSSLAKPDPFATPPRISPARNRGAGGAVPDMDDADTGGTQIAAMPAEPVDYDGKETIEHQAYWDNMKKKESTTFDMADLTVSSPTRTTTPPEELTPKPMRPIDLPKTDNPNAEINRMISADNKSRVPSLPPPVIYVPGEMHADSSHAVRLMKF